MSRETILIGLGAAALLYAMLVLSLVFKGRRSEAAALARFIPDCVGLFRRLLADHRVPGRRKTIVALVVAYLLFPLDLVPDFIPVAGQLDDAIVVAFALRFLLRSGDSELLRELWPGPPESLAVVTRLAFGRPG